jgi:hypothetical protein
MLYMNILSVFNNVSHARLLNNLRKRKIPDIIIRWVTSFLRKRIIIIKMFEGESKIFNIKIKIS